MSANGSNADSFKRDYGRLCVLTAKAIKQGHNREVVAEAARGKGLMSAPVYVDIRMQRRKVEAGLQRLKTQGVTDDELIADLGQARAAVQAEWMIKLPMFAEVRNG
jgi:hypothetical protein